MIVGSRWSRGLPLRAARLIFEVSRNVEADLREALYERLVRQPPSWFDGSPPETCEPLFQRHGGVRMMLGPGICSASTR